MFYILSLQTFISAAERAFCREWPRAGRAALAGEIFSVLFLKLEAAGNPARAPEGVALRTESFVCLSLAGVLSRF